MKMTTPKITKPHHRVAIARIYATKAIADLKAARKSLHGGTVREKNIIACIDYAIETARIVSGAR